MCDSKCHSTVDLGNHVLVQKSIVELKITVQAYFLYSSSVFNKNCFVNDLEEGQN